MVDKPTRSWYPPMVESEPAMERHLRDLLRELVARKFPGDPENIRAAALAIGMPYTTLFAYLSSTESAARLPTPGNLRRLMDALGASDDEREEGRRLLEQDHTLRGDEAA
jgi:hypothetical protein